MNNSFKFWWWQSIKKTVGYANKCSRVQDHRLKIQCIKFSFGTESTYTKSIWNLKRSLSSGPKFEGQ